MQEKSRLIYIEGNQIKVNKNQLKIRLLTIIIIFLITYAVGEIAVRVFDPQMLYNKHDINYPTYPKEVEYDEDLGWSLVKNYKVTKQYFIFCWQCINIFLKTT